MGEKETCEMMKYNGSSYSDIQGSSAAAILRNIDEKVAYLNFLRRKTLALQILSNKFKSKGENRK